MTVAQTWLLLSLALWAPATAAQPPEKREYSVIGSGSPAGEMTVQTEQGGETTVRYRYNDRGRGPNLIATHRLDLEGRPLELKIGGVDYYKTPVNEQFLRTGREASWQSAAEVGNGAGEGFYVPYQSAPEHIAVLARAMLRTPGKAIDLLPAGRARLAKVRDHEVRRNDEQVQLSLYFVEGLWLSPSSVWLDRDGTLFFSGSSWSNVVRKGWESIAPELIRLQDEASIAWEAARARTLQRRPDAPVLIRNARLFDSSRRRMVPGTTVLVRSNRIAAVGPDASIAAPSNAEIIDADGKTLLPGLWDNHVHVGDAEGLLHIAAGVTTVRDLANDMDELLLRRKRFDTGELIGPRVIMAGFLEGPGPLAGPTKALVDTPEEVRDWIRRYADAGYVQVKLYSSLDPALVPVAIAAAHARGLRVSGHVPARMTMEEAIRAGFDEVQHPNYWFLNFMGPEVNARTNDMTRFYAVGERGKDLDLRSAKVRAFVDLLKSKRTVLDPTLVTFESLFLAAPRQVSPDLAPVADRLPPNVRREVSGGGLAKTDQMRALYGESFQRILEFTRMMYEAGLPILPGTDAMAGFAYHRELELYARAGIPTADILYMATLGSARVNRRDKELGSIAVGKLADLVLVDGDPIAQISDIRRTALVMKDGVLFDPAKVYEALGVAPADGAR